MEEQDSILDDLSIDHVESTHPQKVFSGIIDAAMFFSITFLIVLVLPKEIRLLMFSSYRSYISSVLIFAIYRIVFLLIFGKTLGMMVTKMKFLNKELQPLTSKEKLTLIIYKPSYIKYYKD